MNDMSLLCFRYATEVDVDFVRKSVRAIGRCAIKVEQAAERCVSTLLDLIQTKVNYVVQEAIVVIKASEPYSWVFFLRCVPVHYRKNNSYTPHHLQSLPFIHHVVLYGSYTIHHD